jgi:hypothetical protein
MLQNRRKNMINLKLLTSTLLLILASQTPAAESRNKKSCEEIRDIAAESAKLAERGISSSEAISLLNIPSAGGIINLVYEGKSNEDRQRIVRDIYSVCQSKRASKPAKISWSREEFKKHFFGICKNSKTTKNLDCNCFATTTLNFMSESDLETARANADIFIDKIKTNKEIYNKCEIK